LGAALFVTASLLTGCSGKSGKPPEAGLEKVTIHVAGMAERLGIT
jgi:hypothetical protein